MKGGMIDMQHTTNYNLNKWEDADRVTRADVNADNAKIDAALTGLDAAVAANAAAIAGAGNVRYEMFTYEGEGVSGPEHPTVISFPHKPLFFFAMATQSVVLGMGNFIWCSQPFMDTSTELCTSTWDGLTLSFYSSYGIVYQGNERGTHYVLSFYTEED